MSPKIRKFWNSFYISILTSRTTLRTGLEKSKVNTFYVLLRFLSVREIRSRAYLWCVWLGRYMLKSKYNTADHDIDICCPLPADMPACIPLSNPCLNCTCVDTPYWSLGGVQRIRHSSITVYSCHNTDREPIPPLSLLFPFCGTYVFMANRSSANLLLFLPRGNWTKQTSIGEKPLRCSVRRRGEEAEHCPL